MKKEFLKGITMLLGIVALAFVTAVASNAQSANKATHQLVVVIPFEFSIDYKAMPAGEYVVQTVPTANDALLIQSADGKNSALRPSEPIDRLQKKEAARLVFHRYGQRYFLAEVWTGSDTTGRQLMKSRDELAIERELASITSKSELAQNSYEAVEVLAAQILAKLR